jgi:hypothetical protein
MLIVRIKAEDGDLLKVSWRFESLDCKPYFVRRSSLIAITADMRAALQGLVRPRKPGGGDQARNALLDLARQGERLRKSFFQADADRRNDRDNVKRIADKVEAEGGHPGICFFVGSRVHIPWGLMYSGKVDEQLALSGPAGFPGFWCTRFRLATVYQDAVSPFDFDCCYPATEFGTLMAADGALMEKTAKHLTNEERALFELLSQQFGGPVHEVPSLGHAWEEKQAKLGLFYFYGHADNTRLALSALDTFDLVDFENTFQKGNDSPKCLVFLNGCYTASGDGSQSGFLEATGRYGFCGFIGAEAEVPDAFALRFGLAFQKLLYEGLRVNDILDLLRPKHWPLSLIYGLYAYPELRLTPVPGLRLPSLPDVNYSELVFGPEAKQK